MLALFFRLRTIKNKILEINIRLSELLFRDFVLRRLKKCANMVPTSITYIPVKTAAGRDGLEVLGDGITKIGNRSFKVCTKLKRVVLTGLRV